MNQPLVATGLDWVSQAGIAIMKQNQDASGAFLASPNFPVYRYSWLRDGSYIALALNRAGERRACHAFHAWTAGTINTMAPRIAAITEADRAGRSIDPRLLLPTRYLTDGSVENDDDDPWPNIQFDGYGTWLWALADQLGDRPLTTVQERAAVLAADYLTMVWRLPCYDYWEEYGDRLHTSTLASITAGLRAAAALTGVERYAVVADEVWAFLQSHCVRDGHFTKGPQDNRVDASLLSLAVPFGLIAADEPRYAATVARIESELTCPDGGVWRYLGDTYYGGGTWILLTCWLGLAKLGAGDRDAALAKLAWARDFASPNGSLPEQVTDDQHTQQPAWRQPWIDKWGAPADPLLWSQAMYLLLDDALQRSTGKDSAA